MAKKTHKKSPVLAAILNFFVWGLGYLYLGKRTNFGIILVIGEIIAAAAVFTEAFGGINSLGLFVIGIAFAVDAHNEATVK
jgi:hypothetical protein